MKSRHIKNTLVRKTCAAVLALSLMSVSWADEASKAAGPQKMPGLKAAAEVIRDTHGIAHIRAGNDHDLYFMQGYVHAQDRLFQMDVSRRRASGTLAELLGPDALAGDVEFRTIGMRRAAARSQEVISKDSLKAFEAYAEGVNAYVAGLGALPSEYQALEISKFEPWTVLDGLTVTKLITFGLAFGLEDIDNTVALQTYTGVFDAVLGAGTGYTLFSEDLWRSQPFSSASTVPDASVPAPPHAARPRIWRGGGDATAAELAKRYGQRIRNLPFFKDRMQRDKHPGSNQWAVSGALTTTGKPLLANDPHLALDQPSTFYPIHLTSGNSDAMGSGFAGVPFVIVGQTREIAWGVTVSPLDVTDVFQEQVVTAATEGCMSPSQLCTLYNGQFEPIIPIPETYRVNVVGDAVPDNLADVPTGGAIPPFTLVVPRRNNGPIVEFDQSTGAAISIQYTGFSGTREPDTFWTLNRARNLDDFRRGLKWFDSGTSNFAYADIAGNIAYYATSEVPVREDLQNYTVTGLPPWFIRNGTGGNEWVPLPNPPPGQAIPYEILPAAEMPHLVNPRAGWFVNANNDPAATVLDNDPLNQPRPSGGLYYLSWGYDTGFRAGRITELIKGKLSKGRVSFDDMQAIQADVALPDAQYFVPLITRALARPNINGVPLLDWLRSQPGIAAAVGRLAAWTLTAPTGIPQGYDASDVDRHRRKPSDAEIAESVAATIYSVWRGQFIRNTIDATLDGVPLPSGVSLPKPPDQLALTALKSLLERPDPGVGVSGINFFNLPPGVVVGAAADRRDILILQSLADSLASLSGSEFKEAFGFSTDQDDYRWGKLHRIVFEHPLGSLFSVPSDNPLGNELPGFPTDGGYGTVDSSNHDVRAQGVNDFMFSRGPVNRFVAEASVPGVSAESVWPGGTSADPNSSFYLNLMPKYLTNETVPLLFRNGDLRKSLYSVSRFVPAK